MTTNLTSLSFHPPSRLKSVITQPTPSSPGLDGEDNRRNHRPHRHSRTSGGFLIARLQRHMTRSGLWLPLWPRMRTAPHAGCQTQNVQPEKHKNHNQISPEMFPRTIMVLSRRKPEVIGGLRVRNLLTEKLRRRCLVVTSRWFGKANTAEGTGTVGDRR